MPDVHIARKEVGHLRLAQPTKRLLKGVKNVGHRPRLDVRVVCGYGNIGKDSEYPEVLPKALAAHGVEDERRAVVAPRATKTA